jgi:hypothetical protein
MIFNITLTAIFLACAVWMAVRGFTVGWTASTILLLIIALSGLIGRLEVMRREKRRRL